MSDSLAAYWSSRPEAALPSAVVLRGLYSLLAEGGVQFPSLVLDSESDWAKTRLHFRVSWLDCMKHSKEVFLQTDTKLFSRPLILWETVSLLRCVHLTRMFNKVPLNWSHDWRRDERVQLLLRNANKASSWRLSWSMSQDFISCHTPPSHIYYLALWWVLPVWIHYSMACFEDE